MKDNSLNSDSLLTMQEFLTSKEKVEKQVSPNMKEIEDVKKNITHKDYLRKGVYVIFKNSFTIWKNDSGKELHIDDKMQLGGSSKSFCSKYWVTARCLSENENTVVMIGIDFQNATRVAIKIGKYNNKNELKKYLLEENIHKELQAHWKANSNEALIKFKSNDLNLKDWYVYDTYYVIVTDYEKQFRHLYLDKQESDSEESYKNNFNFLDIAESISKDSFKIFKSLLKYIFRLLHIFALFLTFLDSVYKILQVCFSENTTV